MSASTSSTFSEADEGKGLPAVGGKENMELIWVFPPQHGGNGLPDDGFVVNDQ